MNCTECQERLEEYSLATLPTAEANAVEAHLASGCGECQQELDECRAALAAVALSVPIVEPPAAVKRDLMARVRGEGAVPASVATAREAADRGNRRWATAAYVAATIGGLAAGVFFMDVMTGSRGDQAARIREFEERLAAAQQTFDSPRVRFAAFDFSDARVGVAGYLAWDILAGQAHFAAFDLGAPAAGDHYQLWFVTRDEKWLPAGVLEIDDSGHSSAVVDLPTLPKDVVRAVVTEEPATSAPIGTDAKPQGKPRLIADFS